MNERPFLLSTWNPQVSLLIEIHFKPAYFEYPAADKIESLSSQLQQAWLANPSSVFEKVEDSNRNHQNCLRQTNPRNKIFSS